MPHPAQIERTPRGWGADPVFMVDRRWFCRSTVNNVLRQRTVALVAQAVVQQDRHHQILFVGQVPV